MNKCKNGFSYSREIFEGYKSRSKVLITNTEGDSHSVDIYSDQNSRFEIQKYFDVLAEGKKEDVEVIYFSTKENDEADSELISEILGKNDKILE